MIKIEKDNINLEEKSSKMYPTDTEVQKKPIGNFIPKSEFLEPKKVKVFALGTNLFGGLVLEIEYNGQLGIVNISGTNQNQLINLFGNKIKDWLGKEVIISGSVFNATDTMKEGIMLSITLP